MLLACLVLDNSYQAKKRSVCNDCVELLGVNLKVFI